MNKVKDAMSKPEFLKSDLIVATGCAFAILVCLPQFSRAQIVQAEFLTLVGGASKTEKAYTNSKPVVIDSVRGWVIQCCSTNERDLPVTENAFLGSYPGGTAYRAEAVYLAVYDLNCTNLIYATYLGGALEDYAYSLIWYDDDHIVMTGQTQSTDFPVTANAQQKHLRGESDIWYATFDLRSMEFDYITYLGGSGGERPDAVYRTEDGRLLILGLSSSWDLPHRPGNIFHEPEIQGYDAVVFVLDNHELQHAVFFGGSRADIMNDVVEMDSSFVFVGSTRSRDMYTTTNAFQPDHGGVEDMCIIRVDKEFRNILYSTFVGGNSNEWVTDVLRCGETVHIVGYAYSDPDTFPWTHPPMGKEETFGVFNFGIGTYIIYDAGNDTIPFAGVIDGNDGDFISSIVDIDNDHVLLAVQTGSDTLFNLVNPFIGHDEGNEIMQLLVEFDTERFEVVHVQFLWTGTYVGLGFTHEKYHDYHYFIDLINHQVPVDPDGYRTAFQGLEDIVIGRIKLLKTSAAIPVSPEHPTLEMTFYPNPARAETILRIDGPPGAYSLQLCGIDGKVVSQQRLQHDGLQSTFIPFQPRGLPCGLYFLTAVSEDGRHAGSTALLRD
jgi:hypothetical protein